MHLASVVRVALGGFLVLALGAYALSFRFWQDRIGTPSVELSIASGARDVAPGTPISVKTAGWNTAVTSVALARAELDERGNWARSAAVPVRLALQPIGERPGDAIGRVLGADGRELVVPDARYTLVVHGVSKQVVFPVPWPQDV